ncbi:MAG TPA: TonB-dependent receptor [Bryobacteraceae bacterium]|nr:TonB-dependent receptor [Bryobacteraceae bacterium]
MTRLLFAIVFGAVLAVSLLSLSSSSALAQSTGAITGTVSDPQGLVIPNASITVTNQATGEERTTATDTAGIYLVPSLLVGKYRVEAKSSGMQTTVVTGLDVSAGNTTRQDFQMAVSATTQTIEISAAAPIIDTSTTTVGDVINQQTVQEIPLNGRHFVDLALLVPGTVTPPANGFLTAPLRGQGSFAFDSAGARESSINYLVNGINLSDPSQNQVTFQPTINTIEEISIDNQTFDAEYGRDSGSIVLIATRQGTNAVHGELYEFLRNDYFDARNWSNPTHVVSGGQLVANPEAPFIRNQFGGDVGLPFKKNKFFGFFTYEELRQRQSVPLSFPTLTGAQRSQIMATSDKSVQGLLSLIPLANSGTNQFVGSAVAPVNIYQGTTDETWVINSANRFNFYYAIQRDQRNEPPTTDGNDFPGGGDMRNGHRQLMTLNETWVPNANWVNEARLGFNRILITFNADQQIPSSEFGINNGGVGTLPQVTVSGNFTFGGISGFPQGRGDNVEVLSDTLSWVHGNHSIRFGGEFRPELSDNFSATPGTFTFASIAAFMADQATSFSSNTGNRSNRTYANAIGAYVTDAWKVRPTLTVTLGLRYDWFGTPYEAENRFVNFNLASDELIRTGTGGGPSNLYNQSALNFQPRVGIAWDPFKNGRTVVRSSYAIMTDQNTLGLATGAAGNPPFAVPVSFTPSASVPFVSLENAFTLAGGLISPFAVAQNYKTTYVSEYNFNISQQLGKDYAVSIGYFGNKGTDENIAINANQPINGAKPYPFLSMNSPIDPGLALGNITTYESVGNSNYNALMLHAIRRFAQGLQFDASYTWSKSIDYVSQNQFGASVQNGYDIAGDRGLSDFNVPQRVALSGVWNLPFHGNRLKQGWTLSVVEQAQAGSPLNFHISTTTLTGGLTTVRPDVTGPVKTGFSPATNGSNTSITYIQNPQVFFDQGASGFGNLGRNVIQGPGFFNTDISLMKSTKITERFSLLFRADAFDVFNQANFTNPITTLTTLGQFVPTATSTFGLITSGTRFPAGDFGTSRQLQLSLYLQF